MLATVESPKESANLDALPKINSKESFINSVENNFIQYESLKDPDQPTLLQQSTAAGQRGVGYQLSSRSVSSSETSSFRNANLIKKKSASILSLNTDPGLLRDRPGADLFLSPSDGGGSAYVPLERSEYNSIASGINSKSLPHTRRNSLDLSAIWTTIQTLDLDDSNYTSSNLITIAKKTQELSDSSSSSLLSKSYSSSPSFAQAMLSSELHTDEDIEAILSREARGNNLSQGSAALDLATLPQTSPSRKLSNYRGNENSFTDYGNQPEVGNYPLMHPAVHQTSEPLFGEDNNNSTNTYKFNHAFGHTNSNFQMVRSSSMNDLSRHSQQPLSNLCRYFQQGYCSRGEKCTFIHALPTQCNTRVAGRYDLFQHSMMQRNFSDSQQFLDHNPNFTQNYGGSKSILTKTKKIVMEDALRFYGIPLEELVGQIHLLCQDQNGCRYLQKKLEEQNVYYVDIIFKEVYPHFVDLMIDPFGNYLCQRLMEFCKDAQREALIDVVAPHLVHISLNMHGTRAVQKMIDYLAGSQTVRPVIELIRRFCNALSIHVVPLIKDLNGNHVIQKCLNRLNAEHNQFIYNAVTENCIDVASHRHGCCVLQRCIDHASESQKLQLVSEITHRALTLVQDPFGNYVVQYVLDLGDPRYTSAIIRKFFGNICILSTQKFSSNVIEKSIRVADSDTRCRLISELLNRDKLEGLLKDLYANYVVQTALDCAEPVQRNNLIECIKPILPAIRNTPFGKRIQNKIVRDQIQNNPYAMKIFNPQMQMHPNTHAPQMQMNHGQQQQHMRNSDMDLQYLGNQFSNVYMS